MTHLHRQASCFCSDDVHYFKSKPIFALQIPRRHSDTPTILHRPNETVHRAIRAARLAVGAKGSTIVRNLVKSIVRHNVRRVAVSDRNHVNAVTCSAPVAAMAPHKRTVWPVAISTMTVSANKNAHPCRNTIRPIICGRRIPMANMRMVLRACATVPNICSKTMGRVCEHVPLIRQPKMVNASRAMAHVRKRAPALGSYTPAMLIRSVAAPSLRAHWKYWTKVSMDFSKSMRISRSDRVL